MIASIVVTLRFEALHQWRDCDIPEVDFLRNKHRHVFHVRAEKAVSHNDRDIEIIRFKRELEQHIKESCGARKDLGWMSCEDIAEQIMRKFGCSVVEVLEDGENGAIMRQGEMA